MHNGPAPIRQLAYLGFHARDLAAWRDFAAGYLGMQVALETPGRLDVRMDARRMRLSVAAADADGLDCIGFEYEDGAALATTVAWLRSQGVEVMQGTPAEADARGMSALAWLRDPDGHRVELCHGPQLASTPFVPGRPIGGFRTGDLGLGHAVLQTPHYAAMKRLYIDLLGCRLSDYMVRPFGGTFLHVNPRHHSFAILEWHESAFHHFMVEYNHFDDVGRLYDIAQREPGRVRVTLGRHSNDHMTSFYARTPGGFMVETGWAGRLVDDATWTPVELTSPSIWGHDRSWLPPEAHAKARAALDDFAARGVREPVEVVASPAFNVRG